MILDFGQGGKVFVVGILVVIRAPGLINENRRIVVRKKCAFGVVQGDPIAILTTARKFAVFHLHLGRLVGRFRTHQAQGRVFLFQALGFFQWHGFAVGRLELKDGLRAITAPCFALEGRCGGATCFGDGCVVGRMGLPGDPQSKESGKARCDQRAREMSVHSISPLKILADGDQSVPGSDVTKSNLQQTVRRLIRSALVRSGSACL